MQCRRPRPGFDLFRRSIALPLATLGLALGVGVTAEGATIRHDRKNKKAEKLADRSTFDPVGRMAAGGAFGSATLIDKQWAITAAHVVDTAGSAQFTVGGQTFASSDIVVHKKWTGSVNRSAGYDLALVRLTDNVTKSTRIKPASISKKKDPVGESAWLAGFGLGGNGRKGSEPGSADKRAGTNVIDSISDRRSVLFIDFDNPRRKTESVMGSDKATRFESLVAPGDSGGGLFIGKRKKQKLAGVHSFISSTDGVLDSDYGDIAGHVSLAKHLRWIEKTIRKIDRKSTGLALDDPSAELATLGGERLELSLAAGAAVPAPGTLACLAIGAAALLVRRRVG